MIARNNLGNGVSGSPASPGFPERGGWQPAGCDFAFLAICFVLL